MTPVKIVFDICCSTGNISDDRLRKYIFFISFVLAKLLLLSLSCKVWKLQNQEIKRAKMLIAWCLII